jgi:hypothetical protein
VADLTGQLLVDLQHVKSRVAGQVNILYACWGVTSHLTQTLSIRKTKKGCSRAKCWNWSKKRPNCDRRLSEEKKI